MPDGDRTYCVYALWSRRAERFYVGVTEDLTERVRQHNEGVSHWTRGKGPWRVVWSRRLATLGAARKLENRLKRQKGGQGFYRLTGLSRREFDSGGEDS